MTHKMLAVLVTGDRNATEKAWSAVVRGALESVGFWQTAYCQLLIHGDNGVWDNRAQGYVGLDRIAASVVADSGDGKLIPMPFMEAVGPSGGPRRNEQMVRVLTALREVGYETVCLAFHDTISWSKGTKSCHNRAFAAGHRCIVVRSDGSQTESDHVV